MNAVETWLAARGIVIAFLRELNAGAPEALERNAGALLARLASNEPPLLIMACDDEAET